MGATERPPLTKRFRRDLENCCELFEDFLRLSPKTSYKIFSEGFLGRLSQKEISEDLKTFLKDLFKRLSARLSGRDVCNDSALRSLR